VFSQLTGDTRLPDEAMRRSFLENVAENRELLAEFARSQQVR
jgi:hypothetical protein